jgi:adenylate cyclase
VIGVRKFAYDLWGDTVNLASRLEEYGVPGHVLVAESTASQLADRFDFAPTEMMDLKGKGPTPVRILLGRRSDVPVATPSSAGSE